MWFIEVIGMVLQASLLPDLRDLHQKTLTRAVVRKMIKCPARCVRIKDTASIRQGPLPALIGSGLFASNFALDKLDLKGICAFNEFQDLKGSLLIKIPNRRAHNFRNNPVAYGHVT